MKAEDIIKPDLPIGEVVQKIKNLKSVEVMPWSDLVKEYNPKLHEIITNKRLRPDKKKKGGGTEKVARVTYGMQKLATRRMTQMAFSIPVKRTYDTGNDTVKIEQAKAIEEVYKAVRINSLNIKRMNAYFAACEICSVWYPVKKEKNKTYGFECNFELKCRTYSPMEKKFSRIECAELYPVLDRYDQLVLMGISYTTREDNKDVEYFDCYTQAKIYNWKKTDDKWIDEYEESEISIGKSPIAYLCRPMPIWEDTTNNTQEIEFTLSRESDIIKKNSAPVLEVIGKLLDSTKEEPETDAAREVYNIENGGSIKYATWEQQVEAMKFYVDTLKQNTAEELQLPNLSMENIKGLGVMSGEARKTLLTDAHLKVGDESGDIIEFLDREFNIIKAFLGQMNNKWKESIKDLKATHEIIPFIQNDEQAQIEKIMKATGGKSIMSQKKGIEQAGFCQSPEDVDKELKQLQDEAASDRLSSVFEVAK